MTRPAVAATEAYASCRKLLGDYPVVFEQPVSWGELDAFGHVNNICYFRYFENARIAYFHAIGFTDLMEDTRVGPILAETRCRFLAALQHPDYIAVGARVANIDSDRFLMEYAVAGHAANRIVAEGSGLVVCYDYAGSRKTDLPESILQRIREHRHHIADEVLERALVAPGLEVLARCHLGS